MEVIVSMKSINEYMLDIESAKTKEELVALYSEYTKEKIDVVERKEEIKEKITSLEEEYNELNKIVPNFAVDIRSDILLRIGKIELARLTELAV